MIRAFTLLLTAVGAATAFTTLSESKKCSGRVIKMLDRSHEIDTSISEASTRRDWFSKVAGAMTVSSLLLNVKVGVALAKTDPPTQAELDRIKKGYEGIDYLLKNWDKETTTCRENGGECKRDAEPVRRYMGLRSTTDPLFQIEKVFDKVKYMDDVDLDEFFAAAEEWNSCVSMSNSMAFISQFGEYNPSGGKEEVLKYLNESKKMVVQAESSLKTIIDVLKI